MSEQEQNGPENKEETNDISQDLLKESNSVGQLLRRLRTEQELELEDISKTTNISISNLVSVEEETYERLPADPFIRGQIAIYGNLLGIDGAEAAKKFLEQRQRQRRKEEKLRQAGRDSRSMSVNKLSEPSYVSSATVAAFLLILLVLAVTAFSLLTGWNPFADSRRLDEQPVVPLASSSSLPAAVAPKAPAESEQSAADASAAQQQEEEGDAAEKENGSSAAQQTNAAD
jgi:cytoskeletal protein RodZ